MLISVLKESLEGTRWASAQVSTIGTRLLKVGARVVEACRKIWLHLPTALTDREMWALMCERLR